MSEELHDEVRIGLIDAMTEFEVGRRLMLRASQDVVRLTERMPPIPGSSHIVRHLVQSVQNIHDLKVDLISLYDSIAP